MIKLNPYYICPKTSCYVYYEECNNCEHQVAYDASCGAIYCDKDEQHT